jgi:WD40 repeat protein
MKKVIIVAALYCTVLSFLAAQDVEIYPELGPSGFRDLSAFCFSPDGKWILNRGGIWNIETGRELKRPGGGYITGWSPDMKRYMAAADFSVEIRDWESNAVIVTIGQLGLRTNTAVFSPDGKQFAAITGESLTIQVWDAANGQEVAAIAASEHRIDAFSYGSGGKNIIYREGGAIKVFDLAGKRQLRSFPVKNGYSSYMGSSFSPDGKRYAQFPLDQDKFEQGHVTVYDTETGREMYTLEHNDQFSAIDHSPDGKYIMTAAWDKVITIREAESGRGLRTFEAALKRGLMDITYSPDGRRVAYLGDHSKIVIVDAETFRELTVIGGTTSPVTSLYTGETNRIIAGVSDTDTLHQWDMETGRRLWTVAGIKYPSLYFFPSPNKRYFIAITETSNRKAGANDIKLFDMESGRLIRTWQNGRSIDTEQILWSPDSRRITAYYYTSSGREDIRPEYWHRDTCLFDIWDVETGQRVSTFQHSFQSPVLGESFSPDGKRILYRFEDSVQIWDAGSDKKLFSIDGYFGLPLWSPDSRRIAAGSGDGIKIWDAETGAAVRTITGHTEYVNEARYSPDGRRIVSCADDKLLKIWDAETGREIRSLSGHTDLIIAAAWSPDGRRIASGSAAQEKTIRIWDAESGRTLRTITGQGGRINALAYSPDGKKIAAVTLEDRAVKLYDVETGRLIKNIPVENNAGACSLAWSPDGKRLATGAVYGGEDDYGNHLEIWNAETGENIRTTREGGSILSLAFTPDGRRIVAGCTFSNARFIKVLDALTGNQL